MTFAAFTLRRSDELLLTHDPSGSRFNFILKLICQWRSARHCIIIVSLLEKKKKKNFTSLARLHDYITNQVHMHRQLLFSLRKTLCFSQTADDLRRVTACGASILYVLTLALWRQQAYYPLVDSACCCSARNATQTQDALW